VASTNWTPYRTIRLKVAFVGREPGEKKVTPGSDVEANLQSLIESRTAGDPDDESIRFTDLTPTRIEIELTSMQTPASDDLIRRWMDEQNLRLRKIDKVIAGGHSEDRDAQFLNIAALIDSFKADGNPVFSIDTKSGRFVSPRACTLYCSVSRVRS